MSKEILVNIKEGETRVAITENGILEDFYIERDSAEMLLGNIYKGRVESILPSINAAFVNIGQEKNGFLYLTDIVSPLVEEEFSGPKKFFDNLLNLKKEQKKQQEEAKPLAKGDEVIVQVVKEPFGTKGARLTSHVSLPGRFIVFMPYDKHLGVSKRIDTAPERQRLREILKDLDFAKNSGFIIRTVALEKGRRESVRDAKFLYDVWQKIRKQSETKQAPSLLYKEYDLIWRIVRDFLRDDIDSIIVDSQEAYNRIRNF
ncbi:MAG: ribonuclease E/G, partial [Candidatus Omnitrophica bacterium]|nr:ribonuclease E/G [Candidatus Omnitrophota bacterium]